MESALAMLARLREHIKAARARRGVVEAEADVEKFMQGVYELGLAVSAGPDLLANHEVQTFLQTSGEELSSLSSNIHWYINKFDSWLRSRDWAA